MSLIYWSVQRQGLNILFILLSLFTKGNKREWGSCIKDGFFYFSPNFSTQMNVSLPFEGHNVAYQSKGLDQSNIVCEYEVNLSTNDKVITEKQNFNTNC